MFHDNWLAMPMMWFLWLPLLVILIVVIYRLLKNEKASSSEDSPLEILKKRYARGEISKEEFEERKRNLLD